MCYSFSRKKIIAAFCSLHSNIFVRRIKPKYFFRRSRTIIRMERYLFFFFIVRQRCIITIIIIIYKYTYNERLRGY